MLGWAKCQPRFCLASWFPVRLCQSGMLEGEWTNPFLVLTASPRQHCFLPAVAGGSTSSDRFLLAIFPELPGQVTSRLLRHLAAHPGRAKFQLHKITPPSLETHTSAQQRSESSFQCVHPPICSFTEADDCYNFHVILRAQFSWGLFSILIPD